MPANQAEFGPELHSPEEIRFLQGFLRGHGTYSGPVDGTWHPGLTEALRAYQTARGLGVSGRLDDATRFDIGNVLHFVAGQAPGGPDAALDAKVRELYGPGLAILLGNAELAPILREAAKWGWDELRLQGALEQTDWWRQNGEAERRWSERNATDPESANHDRREMEARVWDLGHQVGIGDDLTPELAKSLTEDALTYGWSDDQLQNMLAALVQFRPDQAQAGAVGVSMADIQALAGAYLVPVSEHTAFDMAKRIAMGELTIEAAETTFRFQATERFRNSPEVVAAISAGTRPADLFSLHRETIARTLEIAPDQVDFVNDPRWADTLGVRGEDGLERPMTLSELRTYVRSQDEWRHTDNSGVESGDLFADLMATFTGTRI